MKYIKLFLISLLFSLFFSIQGQCSNKVVIIDPGHGGEALGGNMDDRIERDINLITATAFKERLEMYEGVEVYITRDNNEDPDKDRKTRFKIAKEKNADLFCSVHYNMSEFHTLYGTEVWTPMTGINYSKSMEFATILNTDLANLGLFNRGVKHREASDGSEYYGILKYGLENNIPSVIIEHCHLDNENDSIFWNEESYRQFGITDADAVAKYFRLTSASLGIDYSNFDRITFDIPFEAVRPDKSEPEYCNINLDAYDEDTKVGTITINAEDSDGYIQYYSLSYNDGNTYGELIPWTDRDSTTIQIQIDITPMTHQQLRCMVYNQYDLISESNTIILPYIEERIEQPDNEINEQVTETEKNEINNNSFIYLIIGILIFVLLIFLTLFLVISISEKRRRKRRRKRKKNAP